MGAWFGNIEADPLFVRALEQVFPQVRIEPVVWRNDLIDEEQKNHLFLARAEG